MNKAMISTWKMSYDGMLKAKDILQQDGSVQAAILAAIQDVEAREEFISVGHGGLPNAQGHVQLDSAYMNGNTLGFGGIIEVENVESPIAVAAKLSDYKVNCLLSGKGAEAFAQEEGFAFQNHMTPQSKKRWQDKQKEDMELKAYEGHDTVCVLGKCQDELAAGVSTSGLFMKHEGRVGDSPIIGSGFYSDALYGSAAATGLGEDYTTYYTAEEFASVMESSSGKYSGIGAYVSQNMSTGIITIVKPFDDAPAAEAGILKDDILYAVEGEEVTGEDLNMVVAKLKGEEGTTVNVTIYRAAEDRYIDVAVKRAVVNVPTVTYKMLEDQIGYIQISEFEEVTAEQFAAAVDDLESQGMKSLIFDLRDNGGGLLDSVCDILDRVLPKELLVYTEDKNGNREEEWAKDDDRIEVPMVVLVNGNTASASEIFTGALKDYDEAEIIGTTTFGKGIVQSIVPLFDGSAVKLTSAKYYTPSGVCIHGTGIEPDQVVEYDKELEEDNQLQAAINYLNSVAE